MKVNHKQLYLGLKQQAKVLQAQLNPVADAEKVNEIPENFNQVGWDLTIEKAELMVAKMKELRDNKGKRLTPQFYRSIYNRSLIAINEADKLLETLTVESADVDYEAECVKLNAEIYQLNIQLQEKLKAEAEEAKKAEAEAKKAEAEAQAQEQATAGKSK